MTDVTEAAQSAEAPARQSRRWMPWALAGAVAVALIATTVAVTVAVTGKDEGEGLGGRPGASAAAAPATFTVTGSLLMPTGYTRLINGNCAGRGGYDDIREGAQAVVSVDGKTVGVGKLDEGLVVFDGCRFTFAVANVPAGHAFYSVQISHRGEMRYPEAKMRNEVVELTLG